MAVIYLYLVLAVLVALIATLRGRVWWRWLLIALFTTPLIGGLLVMALPRQQRIYLDDLDVMPPEGSDIAIADSTIRVIRMSGYSDRSRPYEIFVNGRRVGIVAHDAVVDLAVPHGEQVIEVRTAHGGSRPLLIETAAGQRADIYVAKRPGHLRALLADLFGPANNVVVSQGPGLPH